MTLMQAATLVVSLAVGIGAAMALVATVREKDKR
jgi:hypothetical protein